MSALSDRLPSIAGWLCEYNTFRMLAKACNDNSRKGNRKIGVIRGPSHAATDGALIIDPPPDFPFDDPIAAWGWARNFRDLNRTFPLQSLRFDVKLGLSAAKPKQWAPFFVVIVPEFPDFVCIIPIRSYHNLFNVHRRAYCHYNSSRLRDISSRQQQIIFPDILSPFAIHRDDIYEAIISLVDAALDGSCYVNPTNKVHFHGWIVPDVERTMQEFFRVNQREQEQSRQAIEILANFVEKIPEMRIALNPVDPLVCDLLLIDDKEGATYHVEHKYLTPGVRSSENLHEIPASCVNTTFNWHFLFNQSGNKVAIHTRQDNTTAKTGHEEPHIIDMSKPSCSSEFAEIIRSNGPIAKERLRSKWKRVDTYDDTIQEDTNISISKRAGKATAESDLTRGKPGTEIQLFSLAFLHKFNAICYAKRRHACITLNNHPNGHAAVVEYTWSDEDLRTYEACGLLPVSLVNQTATATRCIFIRFMPHRQPTKCSSTSQIFEPAMQYTFDIPICSAEEFIYVANSGGLQFPGQELMLDKVVLLPSSRTIILDDGGMCTICENTEKPRKWTTIQARINAKELGGSRQSFSLSQHPILRAGENPLSDFHSLEDGGVYEYFDQLFSQKNAQQIVPMYGSKGLLQRQWNHGDIREQFELGDHPSDKLFHRILKSLGHQGTHLQHPLTRAAFEQKIAEIEKKRKISTRLAKQHALRYFIEDTERGITLCSLITSAGFHTLRSGLHCDQCPDEASCKFLHPSLAETLQEEVFCCGGCHSKKIAGSHRGGCTIRGVGRREKYAITARIHAAIVKSAVTYAREKHAFSFANLEMSHFVGIATWPIMTTVTPIQLEFQEASVAITQKRQLFRHRESRTRKICE
ncbi:hypothetical protein IQ07DRAFT_653625 [Pyrenochaeta sp. DS3sAY3a]|nr:hypothetical protein IQ07DRAFT_653625 [Pyrenochaeta sp. DS3sAY3a]